MERITKLKLNEGVEGMRIGEDKESKKDEELLDVIIKDGEVCKINKRVLGWGLERMTNLEKNEYGDDIGKNGKVKKYLEINGWGLERMTMLYKNKGVRGWGFGKVTEFDEMKE